MLKPKLGKMVLVGALDDSEQPCVLPAVIIKVLSEDLIDAVILNGSSSGSSRGGLILDTEHDQPSLGHWMWSPWLPN